jgi:methyl-accepting chemotaxis protein
MADQNRVHAHQLAEVVERTGAIVTGQEQDTLRVASAMEQMTVRPRWASTRPRPPTRRIGPQSGSMAAVVVQTRESISQLADEMVETVQAVSRLEQETQQIGSVLDVIRGWRTRPTCWPSTPLKRRGPESRGAALRWSPMRCVPGDT